MILLSISNNSGNRNNEFDQNSGTTLQSYNTRTETRIEMLEPEIEVRSREIFVKELKNERHSQDPSFQEGRKRLA